MTAGQPPRRHSTVRTTAYWILAADWSLATASTSGFATIRTAGSSRPSPASASRGRARRNGSSESPVHLLRGMAYTKDGDLVFTSLDHRILKLECEDERDSSNGWDGQSGFAGDGGPAAAAQFNSPYGIAITSAGDLIVADASNRRVRRIDGRTGYCDDGRRADRCWGWSCWSTDSHLSTKSSRRARRGQGAPRRRGAPGRAAGWWSDERPKIRAPRDQWRSDLWSFATPPAAAGCRSHRLSATLRALRSLLLCF